jgi:NADH dehydrogenase
MQSPKIPQTTAGQSSTNAEGKASHANGLPTVVILGVGFGGLWATRTLAHAPVNICLIDRHNYHTFFPLLYQVGAAELEAEDIAAPIRHIFRRAPRFQFYLGEVEEIDLANKVVKTSKTNLNYDYLVIGLGSQPNFYNIPGADQYTFTLKTVDQGITLRNHILTCFERAACESDPQRCQEWLTFAIVGGGPTGVEFAGALAELIRGSLHRDYPKLDLSKTRVLLLEAEENLLKGFPGELGKYARRRLEHMGVEVQEEAKVVEIDPQSVRLENGEVISTNTVVWTAGVRGIPGAGQWGLPTARNGQVEVLSPLQVPGHPEVYVVGDLARTEQNGTLLPQVAQVAMQQGQRAGENILRQLAGKEPLPFHYRDKGMLAEIGRNAAAAEVGGHSFTGFLAWWLWLGVHIYYLIGFRNRLLVLINWAWDYFFSEQGVRLIVPANMTEPVRSPEHKTVES